MKKKVIFTMLVHQLIYALVTTFVCFTLGFSIYSICNLIGLQMADDPMWGTRIILVFLQVFFSFMTLWIWRFKKREINYEDYSLELLFKKELADRDKCMSLIKRQLFHVESETSTEIMAFRIVGRIPKRRQSLSIKFEKELTYFNVKLEDTIYPVDYFINNYQVKLSFLNNL